MVKMRIELEQIINVLNEALELDQNAIETLINTRVSCSVQLANHPTIQVRQSKTEYRVGLLGILNGIVGADENGVGYISAVIEEGRLIKLELS